MSTRRRRLTAGLAVATCAAVTASVAWGAVVVTGPTKFIGGKGNQILPAAKATGTWKSWSNSRPGQPGVFDAFVRNGSHAKIKLNRQGQGYNGNFSGPDAIYQQIARNNSNIYIYDTTTGTRHAPPGVNTSGWEFYPRIDGNNVLFGRSGRTSFKVLLDDTTVGTPVVLESHTGKPIRQELPGGVDGDWVTWARYTPRTGHGTVVLYQISTQMTTPLAVPTGKVQYAPAVNNAGDLFYVRATAGACGRGVNIRMLPNGAGTDIKLAVIPRGYDIGVMNAVDDASGTSVYFDRVNCSTGFWDTYQLTIK
jgi:hypothetical protein